MDGWISLHRKVIESEIFQKPPLYMKVWVYLLVSAQHTEYKGLKPGQLRTSIPDIIEAVKWKVGARTERPTKDQIYQILEWMRKPNEGGNESNAKATMITTTKATHGMLINIDNYGLYQHSEERESNGESNGETATNPPRKQRQSDNINNNGNNDNKDNKEKEKKDSSRKRQKPTYAEDSRPYRLALKFKQLQDGYLNEIGAAHLTANSNMQTWADDFRKIIEIDGRTENELGEVVKWLVQDQFWRKNILCPDKLRKQYVNLVVAMQESRIKGAGGTKGAGPKKETLPIVQNPEDGSQTPTDEEFQEYIRLAEEMQRKKDEQKQNRSPIVGRGEGRR